MAVMRLISSSLGSLSDAQPSPVNATVVPVTFHSRMTGLKGGTGGSGGGASGGCRGGHGGEIGGGKCGGPDGGMGGSHGGNGGEGSGDAGSGGGGGGGGVQAFENTPTSAHVALQTSATDADHAKLRSLSSHAVVLTLGGVQQLRTKLIACRQISAIQRSLRST
eukprot:7324737-Prymnesium_polylepis.1